MTPRIATRLTFAVLQMAAWYGGLVEMCLTTCYKPLGTLLTFREREGGWMDGRRYRGVERAGYDGLS